MSQEPTDDLEDRVVEILELPEGEQHAAFTALRAEFPAHEELLLRWENAARAIAPGVLPTEDVASTVPPAPPERIGDYEVKSVLGSGGMGTVYLAEQQQPVQRQVAIKLIHVALDGARVMDRFDLERRALARMNHDAIAKVFDAGTTESGQPYFVMEHVPGVPLLEYCDSHELRVRDRIQLFRQICAGVQHAHQRGVIHRDLKPGNILVMTDGDRATPKIIDFGLARATDRTLVQEAAFTMQGQVLGTPEYMSPEQATNDTQQIDTRTDIYSLGVILYELLSGGLPFPSAQLRRSGWRGIQHMLRDVEPPKPSTRISGDHRAAQLRRTTAIRLARRLHGDLDWIVSKAMSKDPARRYESAIAFADDLGRHLRHEPVVAGPPNPGYRLAKFVRRNRIPVVGAAAVLVVLITGWVLSWNFYLQETEEAREKARQRQVAEAATAATKKQEALARSHLERFRKLANVVKLVVAIKMARELYPAWPEMIPRLEAWIRDSAEPLAGELDGVRQALMELESRALARSAEELQREREQHPAWPEYLLWKSRVTSFQRAMDIREGKIKPKPVAVPDDAPKDAGALLRLACSKYGYIAEKPGEEALGLALARRAYERSDPKMHYVYLEGLAWALFYNGQDREALAAADQAVRAAPPALKRYIGSRRQSVRQNVRQSKPKLQAAIQAVAKLEARFERERAFCFESLADSYLHTALRRMEKSLVEFVAEEGVKADVGHRLAWARRIEELTLRHPRATATWEEARLAIRNADGVTASGLYAKHPIDLKPQTGLVPIGMNPVTRLWEFYHLRSAFDPGSGGDPARLEIPKHGDDGRIRVGDDTGMVFVLIPGGTFAMGSQAENPQGRNYFRRARANESPVHDVTLEPFFLSRYELTQGQWLRLVGGGNPSFLKPGMTLTTGEKITLAHPVDRITWDVCRRILDQNGLDFPTEAQWEYGCRAGSNTNWFRGNNIRSMRGYGNLWDRTGKRLNSASPVPPVPWEDGYSVTCPVGTFDANAFGLHDVHGNDNEWCRDYFASYTRPVAPGDGERQSGGGGVRVARGGGCSDHAYLARSSYRMPTPAANRRSDITLRPARAIRKSP